MASPPQNAVLTPGQTTSLIGSVSLLYLMILLARLNTPAHKTFLSGDFTEAQIPILKQNDAQFQYKHHVR